MYLSRANIVARKFLRRAMWVLEKFLLLRILESLLCEFEVLQFQAEGAFDSKSAGERYSLVEEHHVTEVKSVLLETREKEAPLR